MKHYFNEGKEIIKKRQYRSNQGRSPRQQENNYKMAFWSMVGLGIIFVLLILTSCSTQFKVIPPTFAQWEQLEQYEKDILIKYGMGDSLDKEYYKLNKLKFNKNGRKKIREIYYADKSSR